MVEARKYLDKNFPKEQRGKIVELNISKKDLTEHLDLSDFKNLKRLDCNWNKIDSINISKNFLLEEIFVAGNRLTHDINIFSHLEKLKILDLGVHYYNEPKFNFTKIQNDFYGSLKSLENCKELEYLCIANQRKIRGGLKYLPSEKMNHFGCHYTSYEGLAKGSRELQKWQENERVRKEKHSNPQKEIKKLQSDLENERVRKKQEIEKIKDQIENEKTEAIRNLKQEINQLQTEKQTANKEIQRINNEWNNWAEEEKKKEKQKLNNLVAKHKQELEATKNKLVSEGNEIINQKEQKIQELNIQITSLEKTKKVITDKLTNTEKLSQEKITDLEQQVKDLNREINQKNQESETIRKELNRELPWNKTGKTLREATNNFIKEKCRNEKYVPTTSDKCLSVVTAPFKWVANKTSTGFALFGFATACPAMFGALGWMLKAWLSVKTGGVAGAFTVANSMTSQSKNIESQNQSLPNSEMNYLPPQNEGNKPTVINIHTLPASKEKGTTKKKKTKKKIKGDS